MASIISAGTTSGTSLNLSGDTSGVLQLASNGSTTAVTIDTNQRAAFVAGTAALPAITTTGDTNTGVWFPAADTVAASTSGSERVRITSGGALLLNETSTAQAPLMQMTGSAVDYNLFTIKDTGTSYSTGARLVMFLNSSDSIAGVISHSGVTSVTYGTSSDERLKENIVDAPNALDKVMDLKVRSYDWKEDSSHVEYGLVAQEVNQVYGEPIGVGGDDVKSDPWNIEYGRLTPILLKAIQELNAKVEAQAVRIAELEGAK